MSTNKLVENVSDESDISSIKQPLDTYAARKKFHQLFNFYIAGLFFVVLVVLLYSMALLSQQYKFSKTLLSDHFTPLKVHLLQQTYLINSNKLIN